MAEHDLDFSSELDQLQDAIVAKSAELLGKYNSLEGPSTSVSLEPREFASWEYPDDTQRGKNRESILRSISSEMIKGGLRKATLLDQYGRALAFIWLSGLDDFRGEFLDDFIREGVHVELGDRELVSSPVMATAKEYKSVFNGGEGAYWLRPDGSTSIIKGEVPAECSEWKMWDIGESASISYDKGQVCELNLPAMRLFRDQDVLSGPVTYEEHEYDVKIYGDALVREYNW